MERYPGTRFQVSLDDLLARIEDLERRVTLLEAITGLASIAALREFEVADIADGTIVSVKSWHSGLGQGGGLFKYNAANAGPDDGGFTIQDAAVRYWERVNTYVVDPAMFGAVGDMVTPGVAATDDTDAFNLALAYCAVYGTDLHSYGKHSFQGRLEVYPEVPFAIGMKGQYDWPAGRNNAGLYIEPATSFGQPDIYCDGSRFTTGDPYTQDFSLIWYDNKNNINADRKDHPTYNYLGMDNGGFCIIEGVTGQGSGGVTTTGWNNGIVTNCRVATIRDCFIYGQRGTPDVASVPQSTTALSWRGIAQIGRDYDARDITDFAVDADGVITVTWDAGSTFDPPMPAKSYVFFDGFDGDLGKAFNWTMCQVEAIDTVTRTFVISNVNGLKLPPYTGGGTFEGSPQGVTCRVQHNKLRWFDKMIHLGQMEGYYVEDNRCIGGSTGLEVNEQLDLTLAGYNHFNSTWRGVYVSGVNHVNASSAGLIFGRDPAIFLAGITISKGASTTGTWTSGTEMPWQMQNGTWVTVLTTAEPRNIANISIAATAVITYTGNDVFDNGDTVYISDLPKEWRVALGLNPGQTVEATVASVNTGAKTFQATGFDTSSLTDAYLDVVDIFYDVDGNEVIDYATVVGGMVQLDSYYQLADVNRTARTFTLKTAVSGANINSNSYNDWTEGRLVICAEPFTLDHCSNAIVKNWQFQGVRDTYIRGVQLIDCNQATGTIVEQNTFLNGTEAALELHGNTNYIAMGENILVPTSTTNQFWDNSTTGGSNYYLHRRNVMPMTVTVDNVDNGTFLADGVNRLFTPPTKSITINWPGIMVGGEMVDREDGLVQGIMNVTDANSADAGLLIIPPFASTADKINLGDLMPRFIMPGRHVDFVYDESTTRFRELGDTSWKSVFEFYNDLWTANGVRQQVSGAGAAIATSTFQEGHATRKPMGVISLSTGTTNAGAAAIGFQDASFRIDQGASLSLMRVALETLSTAGETFRVRLGFNDFIPGGAAPTDGIWWEYIHSESTFWMQKARKAGVTTTVITDMLAAIDTYIYFGMFVNGDGTIAYPFSFTDPATITTYDPITTNLPGSTDLCGWGASIVKAAGTTARLLHVDLMGLTMCNSRGH